MIFLPTAIRTEFGNGTHNWYCSFLFVLSVLQLIEQVATVRVADTSSVVL